jgi:hypothetical protein
MCGIEPFIFALRAKVAHFIRDLLEHAVEIQGRNVLAELFQESLDLLARLENLICCLQCGSLSFCVLVELGIVDGDRRLAGERAQKLYFLKTEFVPFLRVVSQHSQELGSAALVRPAGACYVLWF